MICNFQGTIDNGSGTTRTFNWRFFDQNNNELNSCVGYINATWGFPAALFAVIEKTSSITSLVVKMKKQDNSGSERVKKAQISVIAF